VLNRFSEAVQQSGVDVVPRVLVSGGNGDQANSTGSVMEALLTMLLSDRFGALAKEDGAKPERSVEAEALRQQIYETMKNKSTDDESKKATGKK
jgi:hypothetical protein